VAEFHEGEAAAGTGARDRCKHVGTLVEVADKVQQLAELPAPDAAGAGRRAVREQERARVGVPTRLYRHCNQ
jgi:hypothetical protein